MAPLVLSQRASSPRAPALAPRRAHASLQNMTTQRDDQKDGVEAPLDFVPEALRPKAEGDHYAYCGACRSWFDVREATEVIFHRSHARF